VGEDLRRGRIYLPLEDLARFRVAPGDLARPGSTGAVRRLIAFEVDRAREHYARAAPGIAMLAPSSQPGIRAAYRLYGGILDEVARAGYDVLVRRARLPRRRRLSIVASCLLDRRSVAVPPPVPVAHRVG
jgi:phytoene synthase